MKLQLELLFLNIFIVTCLAASTSSQTDFLKCGNSLQAQFKNLVQKAQKSIFDTIAERRKMEDMRKSTDFGLSKNSQMIELEGTLSSIQKKKNVEVCRSLKETQTILTLEFLDEIFARKVNTQLQVLHKELNQIYHKCYGLQNRVLNDLQEEIRLCEKDPAKCKLTLEYPMYIEDATRDIRSINNALAQTIRNAINVEVNPALNARVTTEIYNPVMECLRRL